MGIGHVCEVEAQPCQHLLGHASKTLSVLQCAWAVKRSPPLVFHSDAFQVLPGKHFNEVKGKDVKVIGWDVDSQQGSFVDDFTNVSRAKEISTGFLSQGADVILPVGGPLYQGAAEAIREGGQDAVILKRGADNEAAIALMKLLQSAEIRGLVRSYGYDL